MVQMNLTGTTFRAIHNSANGALDSETTMTFVSESGEAILGVYSGGAITAGQVVATRQDESNANVLYHCVTADGQLKAGEARAHFTRDADGRQRMHLDWQWLTGDGTSGESEWVEE